MKKELLPIRPRQSPATHTLIEPPPAHSYPKHHLPTLNQLSVLLMSGLILVMLVMHGLAIRYDNASPLFVEIPASLRPGSPCPEWVYCDTTDVRQFHVAYCTISDKRAGSVRFSYDMRKDAISRTLQVADHVTLGEMIQVWGIPDAYVHQNGIAHVLWGLKAARVSSPFKPDSRVTMVLYYLESADLPGPQREWHGFVTPRNTPTAIVRGVKSTACFKLMETVRLTGVGL